MRQGGSWMTHPAHFYVWDSIIIILEEEAHYTIMTDITQTRFIELLKNSTHASYEKDIYTDDGFVACCDCTAPVTINEFGVIVVGDYEDTFRDDECYEPITFEDGVFTFTKFDRYKTTIQLFNIVTP